MFSDIIEWFKSYNIHYKKSLKRATFASIVDIRFIAEAINDFINIFIK